LVAGLVAILGHMFPIWAKFQGGKGMNTAAGVLFALTPITTAIVLGIFVVVLLSFRYVSLASITAAIAFPSTVAIRRYLFDIESLDPSLLVFGAVMAAGIIFAHRSNIKRLLRGNENRVRSFRPAKGMRGRGEL
jgi:glycerol-3-phosphate acyltransferase PlsY